MKHRRPPINMDDPLEYLTHPDQVLHVLRHYPEDPKRSDRWRRFFYPAFRGRVR